MRSGGRSWRSCAQALCSRRGARAGSGGAGTVQGTVKDPTGGVMQAVEVRISNPVSGYCAHRHDRRGRKVRVHATCRRIRYHISVGGSGIPAVRARRGRAHRRADHRRSHAVAGGRDVDGRCGRPRGGSPRTRSDRAYRHRSEPDCEAADRDLVGGLNQVVTLASPGVVADSNGFFHPIGDHAQTQFSIDNQPVTDQQSRVYSNQISPDAVQSMEVITGVAPAEYGDKSSLVVHIVTKSGLDQPKPTGSVSFGTARSTARRRAERRRRIARDRQLPVGLPACGPIASSIRRSSRRCTTPGTSSSFFDRLDAQPSDNGHVPPEPAGGAVRLRRAEHVRPEAPAGAASEIDTFNIAPGYSHVSASRRCSPRTASCGTTT